jgi:hypothetical protein
MHPNIQGHATLHYMEYVYPGISKILYVKI